MFLKITIMCNDNIAFVLGNKFVYYIGVKVSDQNMQKIVNFSITLNIYNRI